jgi:hypothetical protein
MSQSKHVILGVHITNRVRRAGEVQQVFTEYGCMIRTRLGLHEAAPQSCSPNGLILLECVAEAAECRKLVARLRKIKGVDVQTMVFDHP